MDVLNNEGQRFSVEDYRQPGDTDSDAIERAIDAAEGAANLDAFGRRLLTRSERAALMRQVGCLDGCRLSIRGKAVDGGYSDVRGTHNRKSFSVGVFAPDTVIRTLSELWAGNHWER